MIGIGGIIGLAIAAYIILEILFSADASVDSIELFAGFLGLSHYVIIWLLSTKGRYGVFKFSNLLIMFIWMMIPIINWGVVYYFGKGIYMWLTKQDYVDLIEN